MSPDDYIAVCEECSFQVSEAKVTEDIELSYLTAHFRQADLITF